MISRSQILLPVRTSTIIGSFVLALFLNFLPWPDLRVVPDFVALVLTVWCVRQPRLVGLGIGWMLGLLTDAGNGVLLGQHALAYSVLAFGGIVLHRRVLMFSMRDQVLHVIVLMLANDVMVLAIRMLAGAGFPGPQYFAGSLIAAALWPALSFLFKLPQRPPPDPDRV